MSYILIYFREAQASVLNESYKVILGTGAVGACLVIFIVLFMKILADNRRLGNLIITRDEAHDKDLMNVHKEYRDRLDTVTKMLIEEKDARRSELFKVASDYSAMAGTIGELGSAVKSLAERG